MRCYEHNVHDINVAVAVKVVVRLIAGIPTFAAPAAGDLV